MSDITQNMIAYLAMLAHSEGTDRANDPYRVCYGYPESWAHTIVDLTYHPAETRPDGTREWHGEKLDRLGPAYVGEWSTAAGRYQMRLSTWLSCKRALNLTDFTAASQNEACVLLVKQCGAFGLVNTGRIREAIVACRNEWASLPGGDSGQPEHKLADLVDFYQDASGVLAPAVIAA
jgi:muramidase (phage lysozyme)